MDTLNGLSLPVRYGGLRLNKGWETREGSSAAACTEPGLARWWTSGRPLFAFVHSHQLEMVSHG